MLIDSEFVPFPLYHGTSSHFLTCFKLGAATGESPHKQVALNLFRCVWSALRQHREPEWWEKKFLDQESGFANWQHGQLYVTPSKRAAARYAGSNAAHGGELLTECKKAIDELAEHDQGEAERLVNRFSKIAGFLNERGLPILVEFTNVKKCDLSPENSSRGVSLDKLASMDALMRELVGQQSNFRLAPGRGTVGRVFELSFEDPDNPRYSPFQCRELLDLDQ